MKNNFKKCLICLALISASGLSSCSFFNPSSSNDSQGSAQSLKYTISFYIDGELVKEFKTAGNEDIPLPDTLAVKDHTYFIGWFSDGEEIKVDTFRHKALTKDIKVEAIYKNYIHVKYEMNGGEYRRSDENGNITTGALEDEYLKEGEALYHASSIIFKDNYTFAGWHLREDLTDQAITLPYCPKEDVTLYADWAPEHVTLSNGISLFYNYDPYGYGLGGYIIDGYTGTGTDLLIPGYYKGIAIVSMLSSVFQNKGLNSVAFNEGLEEISDYAFSDNNLTKIVIPNSVKKIGEGAFKWNTNLSDITFGKGIKRVGGSAFSNTAWYISQPTGVLYIGDVFYTYKGVISGGITVKEGTVSITQSSFYNQQDMTSISLPNSLEHIGNAAFYSCSGITNVTLPNGLLEMDSYAFSNTSLKEVIVPTTLKILEWDVFGNCESLKSVTIGDGTVQVKPAFRYSSLEEVTLPESVTSYGNAFQDANNLKKATILDSNPEYPIAVLPDSLTAIYVKKNCLAKFKELNPSYSDRFLAIEE